MRLDLDALTRLFELLSYVIVVLGVPIGLYQYVRAQAQEREEREGRIFDAVSANYLEFLMLCLDHPDLDVCAAAEPSAAGSPPPAPDPTRTQREEIAVAILISIFERAYLLYASHRTPVTEGQWRGWDEQIREFLRRSSFRRAWDLGSASYDPRFVAYMRDIERRIDVFAADRVSDGPVAG